MAAIRGAIPDFMLANPLYIAASVSFYNVDSSGHITTTLATLFADPTSATTAGNPQILDGDGKFSAPVYIVSPVIAVVVGPNVPSHTTGIINVRGTWRGNWTAATVYFSTDFVVDPISGNIYAAATDFTSSASIATDVSAGNLIVIINQASVVSGGAALAIKLPVQVATTANITLSGLQAIDGYTTLANDRVLVKNQSTPAQNGLYNAAAGAWTRTVDTSVASMWGVGMVVDVLNGTLGRNNRWRASFANPFTLGTSANTWTADVFPNSAIPIQIGSAADSAITTGVKGYVTVPYTCTIASMTLLANKAGSIVIDIWKTPYASFPPLVGNSITGSDLPTLSNAQSTQDTALTGWTTTLNAGDVLAFNVNSVSGLQFVTLSLGVTRS